MARLLEDFNAFLQEHRRCGELDRVVQDERVWMARECGVEMMQSLDQPNKDS